MDRVDGELAVARAIGDAKYKQASHKSPAQQKVCAVPDVSHFTASAGDILFVACDGLFEKLSNEELTARLVVELGKFPNDPALVASAMLHASLDAGSRDNMSAIVIQYVHAH
jgi:serine/threonine protein phosphatase PrpC